MALSIKSEKADRFARELAAETGETLTETVLISLQERLDRVRRRRRAAARQLEALIDEVAALPVLESRPPAEILGHDRSGLPA